MAESPEFKLGKSVGHARAFLEVLEALEEPVVGPEEYVQGWRDARQTALEAMGEKD